MKEKEIKKTAYTKILVRKGLFTFRLLNKNGEMVNGHKTIVLDAPGVLELNCDIKGLVPQVIENTAQEVTIEGRDYRSFIDAQAIVIGYDRSKGPLY